ncbi:hypothetical protein ACWEWU_13220 [Staphylococcus xylosus]
MLNKNLKWLEQLNIPEDFNETSLNIKKDNPEQDIFVTEIYTTEDNEVLKDGDILVLLHPYFTLKHLDLVMVENSTESSESPFETHIFQVHIFQDEYELRPLSTYLNMRTRYGKLEDISKEPIVAKAAKVIRNF